MASFQRSLPRPKATGNDAGVVSRRTGLSHHPAIGGAEYLQDRGIRHIRGKPYHPRMQGKIERYHRSLKNIVELDNYWIPEELERQIEAFMDYYKNRRYHEALDNLMPADVYFDRGQAIIDRREKIKRRTIRLRRSAYRNMSNVKDGKCHQPEGLANRKSVS